MVHDDAVAMMTSTGSVAEAAKTLAPRKAGLAKQHKKQFQDVSFFFRVCTVVKQKLKKRADAMHNTDVARLKISNFFCL